MSDGIDVALSEASGRLTIDGVVMHRPAFAVLDVTPLWVPAVRGADLTIPGLPGKLALPREIDSTDVHLRLVLDGRWTVTGEPRSDVMQGLAAIMAWLRANVTDPPGTPSGTRPATLTSPDGSTSHTQDITVVSLTPGTLVGPLWRVTLDVSVPAGAFPPI